MHQSTMSRKVNALVSVICTFALAVSLSMPYLAFASDEEESSPLAMEVTDIPAAAEDEAVTTDEPAVVEDAMQATDLVEDETAQDEATVPDSEPALEVSAADDATSEATPADTATPAATDMVTVTFVGAEGGTKEVQIEKGTVIPADKLPAAPPTATYTEYGQNVTGTFLSWGQRTTLASNGAYFYPADNTLSTNDYYLTNPINLDVSLYPRYLANGYKVEVTYGTDAMRLGSNSTAVIVPKDSVLGTNNALVESVKSWALSDGLKVESWNYVKAASYSATEWTVGSAVDFDVPVTSSMTLINGKCIAAICSLADEENTDTSQFTTIQVNGDQRVKVSGDLNGPNIPEGATVEVDATPVTSGPAYDDLDAAMGRDRIGDVFEVTLLVNGQEVHDGFGTLSISLPIDAAYNGHVIIVYHRHQDGSITTTRVIAKDGYVTFGVTDLSWFAMEDGGLPAGQGGLAQTGDEVPMIALIGIISVAGGIACFSLLNARSRRKGLHAR